MERETLGIIVGPNRLDAEAGEIIERCDRIILFEPLPDACEFIAAQIEGHEEIRLVQAACGQTAGTATLSTYNTNGVSSSLGTLSSDQERLYSRFDLSCTGSVDVQVINLGDFCRAEGIDRIDALLTDAQGMDLTILQTLADWFRDSRIGWVQCEADGQGVPMYNGLPSNLEADFDAFFSQFPQYKKSRVPNRVPWNPDLIWSLQE